MLSNRIAIVLIVVLTLVGLSLHLLYWTQLPDRVATHFGADGRPNDWMSKTMATLLLCLLQVGLPLMFLVIGWVLPRLPASAINIPNREFWLAPDRKADSIAHLTNLLSWIAVLISLEMIAIVHLTFLANRANEPLDPTRFFLFLGIFLVAVFAIAGRSMWRFRLPSHIAIERR